MKSRYVIILLCIFALVGLIDSSLVHLKEIASKTDPSAFASCEINALLNCTSVASSRYAQFFDIPVSQLGIYFYEAAFIIGLVILAGWKVSRSIIWIITVLTGLGLIFSFYLLYMSYFAVGALCIYCLISNLSTLGVAITWFIYSAKQLRSHA